MGRAAGVGGGYKVVGANFQTKRCCPPIPTTGHKLQDMVDLYGCKSQSGPTELDRNTVDEFCFKCVPSTQILSRSTGRDGVVAAANVHGFGAGADTTEGFYSANQAPFDI